MKSIDGNWEEIICIFEEKISQWHGGIIIKGDKFETDGASQPYIGTVRLDKQDEIGTIELTIENGPGYRGAVNGIYEMLRENILKIGLAVDTNGYPTNVTIRNFEPKNGQMLLIFALRK